MLVEGESRVLPEKELSAVPELEATLSLSRLKRGLEGAGKTIAKGVWGYIARRRAWMGDGPGFI
jgi:hypothetical protein